MNDNQKLIMGAIKTIRNKYPELRFTQLLYYVGLLVSVDWLEYENKPVCYDVFNLRDEKVLNLLEDKANLHC